MVRMLLAIAAVGTLPAGCARQESTEGLVRRALQAEYGDQTRLNVSFLGDSQHLNVLLDGPTFRGMADSQVAPTANGVARFVMSRYGRADKLQTVTVRFVRFVPGAGESYCFAKSTTFQPLAGTPPSAGNLVVTRTDLNGGPCLLDPSLSP